jgi:hypothetical protein
MSVDTKQLKKRIRERLKVAKSPVSIEELDLDEYDCGVFEGFEQGLEYVLELIEELDKY